MPLFNRKTNDEKPKNEDFTFLTESAYTNSMSDIKGIPLYNFINAMKTVNDSEFFYGNTYERMMDDSIISSAIDLYVDDATQVDPSRNKMVWVETDMPEDWVEDELSKGLVTELNNFLDEIQISKYLPLIARTVLVHGSAPVKVSFVDKLEDDRLRINVLNESNITDDLLKNGEFKNDYKHNEPININKLLESYKDDKRILNKYNRKYLKESFLKEDSILTYKNVIAGRWYTELLGNPGSICALEAKGKLIALIDRENQNNIITKDNIAFFMNPKATRVTLEVGDTYASADEKEYYTISKGDSFLKNARVAWQVLSALEDILLLTRMTRSILYRIFSVEVANKGNKETMQILNALKNKIKTDETINVREKIYNSTLAQVPLGDSIFIPTRNGIGAIKVDTIGGDFNLKDAIDLDYFKDKLFAALKIPKEFLGFEAEQPGGLGNTSLVRMDIRYARTVRGLQNILVEGVKDIVNIYLKYTRTEKVLKELPNIRVRMTSINTSEDAERVESEKVKMETVDKIVETLTNLGIEMDKYKNVRDKIIQQWFGSDLYDKIKKDEEEMPMEPMMPGEEGPDRERPGFSSTPASVDFTGGEGPEMDFGEEGEEMAPEEGMEAEPEAGEESGASGEEPERPPYSLH